MPMTAEVIASLYRTLEEEDRICIGGLINRLAKTEKPMAEDLEAIAESDLEWERGEYREIARSEW